MNDSDIENAMNDLDIPREERQRLARLIQAYFSRDLELFVSVTIEHDETRHRCRRVIERLHVHKEGALAAAPRIDVVLTKTPASPKFKTVTDGFAASEGAFQDGLAAHAFEQRLEQEQPRQQEDAQEMVIPPWLRG